MIGSFGGADRVVEHAVKLSLHLARLRRRYVSFAVLDVSQSTEGSDVLRRRSNVDLECVRILRHPRSDDQDTRGFALRVLPERTVAGAGTGSQRKKGRRGVTVESARSTASGTASAAPTEACEATRPASPSATRIAVSATNGCSGSPTAAVTAAATAACRSKPTGEIGARRRTRS